MKYILFLLLIMLIFSCKQKTGIQQTLIAADSVAINYFKGDGSADTVVKMIMLKDKAQVVQLSKLIDATICNSERCGFDGTIHFFIKDMVLKDVGFRMNDKDCRHFSFQYEGKNYNTLLSEKAVEFLQAAKK